MSNLLAIATVTAAFRRLLLEAVQMDVPGASVSTLRPGEPGLASGIPPVGINIHLYQVGPIHLRNAHLPARRNGGSVVHRPAVALELDYLLSFYGDDHDYQPQRLMGSAVAKLAAEPLLSKKRIDDTVSDTSTSFLSNSDLADQIESIKFTPLNLSLEEMSRIWSVFFQVKHTLSISYRASPVLVEARLTPVPSLPVLEPLLYTQPLRPPVVSRIVALPDENGLILSRGSIAILGENLRADAMEVRVGDNPVAPTLRADHRLELPLPVDLQAGTQTVNVRHFVSMGEPAEPHPAYQSEAVEFTLHPVIAQPGGAYQIAISNFTGTGGNPRSAVIAVTLTSPVRQQQQVTLELLRAGHVSRTFFAQPRSADSPIVAFTVNGVAPARYVARVRVDGAESPTEVDRTAGSPTLGQPIAPVIDLS